MKILFIHPCYENFGGYFRAAGLAKALAKKGIKVDLVCPHKNCFSFLIKKRILVKNLTRYELPRLELNFFFNGRILRGVLSSFFVLFGNYDLVHPFATTQIETVIPFFVAKILGKKVVFDWDDFWQDSLFFHQTNILIKKYIALLENNVPKYSKFMTVTSDFLCDKAKVLGAKKVLKIINGVDLKQFKTHSFEEAIAKLKFNPRDKYLLSFGNTYENKRAYLLLKTFEEVNKRDRSIKLISNIDLKKLLQKQNKLGEFKRDIFDNIIVTGFIPPQDLGYYLAISECVIFLTGNSDMEKSCFPIRIGSYLNGEKVIVTTNTNTEWCNTLKKYNCVLLGKNPKDLAQKIITFLKNKCEQKKIENNVRKTKKELSWNILSQKLIEFYNLALRE